MLSLAKATILSLYETAFGKLLVSNELNSPLGFFPPTLPNLSLENVLLINPVFFTCFFQYILDKEPDQ